MNIATKVTPNIIATKDVSLEDKYVSDNGTAYMTGIQALVRLPLAQTRRDAMNGYHTAGFISGYRGSPVGNYDSFLWQVQGLIYAELSGDFPLGDSRQPTYKSLRPFDLVS